MGENEQGGMLRTVIVLGLIAIIAGAVIFAVTQSSANNKNIQKDTTTSLSKTIANANEDDVVDDAATSNYNYGDYDSTAMTATVTSLKTSGSLTGKSVDLPDKVLYNGKTYTITTIGANAFKNAGLTGVTLPNGLTSIKSSAFYGNALTSLTVPSTVTFLGYEAFYDNKLTALVLPDDLTAIGDFAFAYSKLTKIILPSALISIGVNAFAYNPVTELTLPNKLQTVGQNAFYMNHLTKLDLPDSLVSVGRNAFSPYSTALLRQGTVTGNLIVDPTQTPFGSSNYDAASGKFVATVPVPKA